MHSVAENPNPWNDRKAVDCKMPNSVLLSSFHVGFRPFINRVNCYIINNIINDVKEVKNKYYYIFILLIINV